MSSDDEVGDVGREQKQDAPRRLIKVSDPSKSRQWRLFHAYGRQLGFSKEEMQPFGFVDNAYLDMILYDMRDHIEQYADHPLFAKAKAVAEDDSATRETQLVARQALFRVLIDRGRPSFEKMYGTDYLTINAIPMAFRDYLVREHDHEGFWTVCDVDISDWPRQNMNQLTPETCLAWKRRCVMMDKLYEAYNGMSRLRKHKNHVVLDPPQGRRQQRGLPESEQKQDTGDDQDEKPVEEEDDDKPSYNNNKDQRGSDRRRRRRRGFKPR
jgi:hypothetical protein